MAGKRFDIAIAGAGYVGLATALAISKSSPAMRLAIIDAAPPRSWKNDRRASAIATSARRMLTQLECWNEILPHAQPINEMVITDSDTADPVRPVFLTFGSEAVEGEPFAHMVPNVALNGALRNGLGQNTIDLLGGVAVEHFTRTASHVEIGLSDGMAINADLLVAADGVNSRLREQAGIKTVRWEYGQSGIVCLVSHEKPHNGRAEEHFLPSGPFAILPMPGNRSSIVWTESTRDADRLVNSEPLIFEAELERRFGHKLGAIRVEDKPRAWPLSLTLARSFVGHRFALAGDAAHGIHPIAGQGLNLGFKDAAALAQTLVEAKRLGRDIGTLDVLEEYQRWRRFDTVQMGITTDVLNRLFSNDIGPVRAIRDIGLGLVDRLPGLKRFFVAQASGTLGPMPRLLRGEPI